MSVRMRAVAIAVPMVSLIATLSIVYLLGAGGQGSGGNQGGGWYGAMESSLCTKTTTVSVTGVITHVKTGSTTSETLTSGYTYWKNCVQDGYLIAAGLPANVWCSNKRTAAGNNVCEIYQPKASGSCASTPAGVDVKVDATVTPLNLKCVNSTAGVYTF